MNKGILQPYVDQQPDRPKTYAEKLHPQPPYVLTVTMTDEEKAQQEAYIKEHKLPF